MKNNSFFKVWWKFVELLPLAIPSLLAVSSAWLVLLLVTGKFTTGLVILGFLPLVLAGILIWRLPPLKRLGGKREKRIFDLLVLLFVLAWCGFNVQYSAKHVLTDRDPGVYTVAATWLKNHDSTNITADKPFGTEKRVIERNVGIWDGGWKPDNKAHLQPQGMHLLPAIAGAAGRIGGLTLLFATSVLLGGAALMAFYAFSRQLMRPGWAFLATLIFGATLPLVYFSRDLFTEPLSATFTMGALVLAWLGYQDKTKANTYLWLLAGFVAGAGVLTRADGYLTIISLSAFLIVATVLEKGRKTLRNLQKSILLFTAGSIPPVLLAYLDITKLSKAYYIQNKRILKVEIILWVLTLVAGGLIMLLARRNNRKLLKKLDRWTQSWRTQLALITFLAAALILISRPIWLKIHSAVINGTVYLVQTRTNIPIDPRTYAEHTVDWISWYIGGFLLVLSIFGTAILIKKVFDESKLIYLGLLFTLFLTGIYFINPKITPDQVWAMRRFLPVIMPCLIAIGVYAASYIYEKVSPDNNPYRFIFAIAAAAYLLFQPLIITRPFARVNENRPDYGAFVNFCGKLPKNAAVLWVGDNSLSLNTTQTTRALCGIQSAGYVEGVNKKTPPDRNELKKLAAVARRNGLESYLAIQGSVKYKIVLTPDMTSGLRPVSIYNFEKVEQTLTGPPETALVYADSIELGKIQPDGSISPVN